MKNVFKNAAYAVKDAAVAATDFAVTCLQASGAAQTGQAAVLKEVTENRQARIAARQAARRARKPQ